MTPLPCSVYAEALKKWITGISGDLSIPVSDVANNSAEVAEGSLFCAIRGAKTDGHRFLADALAKGARAFVVAADSTWQAPDNLPVLRVNDSYRCWALCCETFYGKSADSMDVFAVTGTNGKTTIAYLIRKIFHAAFPEEPCGLLSTVEYDTGAGKTEEAARTTPDALTIQRLFARMKEHHCPRAVMEQSSHGLHQHRTGSLLFAGAVFTNLTGDHLDYHGTMENYFQAKRLLFMENTMSAIWHWRRDWHCHWGFRANCCSRFLPNRNWHRRDVWKPSVCRTVSAFLWTMRIRTMRCSGY